MVRSDPPPRSCRAWAPEHLQEAPALIVLAGLSPHEQRLVTLRQWHQSRKRRFPPVLCLQDEGWMGGVLAAPEEGVNLTLPSSTPVTDVQTVVRLLLAAPRRDGTTQHDEWIARLWQAQEMLLTEPAQPAAAVQATRTVLERLLASRLDDTAMAAALALTLLPDGARPLALWAREFAPPPPSNAQQLAMASFPLDRLRARLIRVGPQRFALPLDEDDQPLPGWPAPAAGVLDRAEGVAFVAWSPLMARLSGFIGTALCRNGMHWLIPQPAIWQTGAALHDDAGSPSSSAF
ncbi:MAG: hypothetical protein C4K60_18470 [Ideonella sp. MAG2]|nr:MAG: hypothetical protein C4K60_18470 [Ideonella sp. MAG2]